MRRWWRGSALIVAATVRMVAAEQQSGSLPTVDIGDLGTNVQVIGRLGFPLGTVVEIEATMRKDLANKPGRYLLEVHRVNDVTLRDPVISLFRVNADVGPITVGGTTFELYRSRKGGETRTISSGEVAELENGCVDRTFTLLAYEQGTPHQDRRNPFGFPDEPAVHEARDGPYVSSLVVVRELPPDLREGDAASLGEPRVERVAAVASMDQRTIAAAIAGFSSPAALSDTTVDLSTFVVAPANHRTPGFPFEHPALWFREPRKVFADRCEMLVARARVAALDADGLARCLAAVAPETAGTSAAWDLLPVNAYASRIEGEPIWIIEWCALRQTGASPPSWAAHWFNQTGSRWRVVYRGRDGHVLAEPDRG